jgi:predicted nuclease with TOPRIM domain
MADEKLFTQEEVNKLVGQARLEGKDAGRKEYEGWISPDELTKQTEDLNKQLSGLNDQLKALTDEKANLQTQLTEKDGQIAKYEIDSVKTRIAREFDLSYEAIGFLQGEDEEAIKKSAESLKALVGTRKAPPLSNPEQPPAEDGVTAAFKKMNPNIKL